MLPTDPIAKLLATHFTIKGTWNLNAQGLVDVTGTVHVGEQSRDRLCVRFGHVSDSFLCFQKNLRTLEGSPQTVGGSFHCGKNRITSLQGGPLEVGKQYLAHLNHLTSLAGAPHSVVDSIVITYYPDTPLLKLFNYKKVEFMEYNAPATPKIWQELFDPAIHPELQGGGKASIIKAVAILSKAGLYKNNPNAQL
jgi:hypothetical protein